MANLADYVVRIIDSGDFCSLLILILLALIAGGAAINNQPRLRTWGQRIAGVAFVLYVAQSLFTFRPKTAEDWIGVLLRAGLASGITLGTSWIVLASLGFIHRYTLALPLTKIHALQATRRSRRQQELYSRQQDEDQRRRDREKLAEEDRKQRAVEAKRECERLRMDCELLWVALAPAIESQFSRDDLRDFFHAYLTEHHSPDALRQRARSLKRLLRRMHREAEPAEQCQSVRDIVERFQQAKAEVADAHLGDPLMEEYLAIELEEMMHKHIEQYIQQWGNTS